MWAKIQYTDFSRKAPQEYAKMNIVNHKFVDDDGNEHYAQANYIGPEITPKYIIMHCTATASPFDRNVATMSSKDYKASVHLLIGRAGEIHQFVPFNRRAYHTGENHWHDVYHNMDRHSIGIEMLNTGRLIADEEENFSKSSGGITYIIPPEDRVLINSKWWQIYPQAQLDAAHSLVKLLFQYYPELKDILGHNEINPAWRPDDPGSAFPMQWFHATILGVDENLLITRVQITSGYSHLYAGPGDTYERVGEGFPKNTPLGVLAEEKGWLFVQLNPDSQAPPFITGWIQQGRVQEDIYKPRHYHRPRDIVIPD
jgi:N-acetylmuramoyl-L-alanine amidase